MEYEILYRPSYSLLKAQLKPGEQMCAEAGAMVSMSGAIEIKTSARGGVFGALKRSFLGGEGLVCELIGPGKIMIQTRSSDALLS